MSKYLIGVTLIKILILLCIYLIYKYNNFKDLNIINIEKFDLEAAPNENEPLYAQFHSHKSDSDNDDTDYNDIKNIDVTALNDLMYINLPFKSINTEQEIDLYNYSKCQNELIDNLVKSDNIKNHITNVNYLNECHPILKGYINDLNNCYKLNDEDCEEYIPLISQKMKECNEKMNDKSFTNTLFSVSNIFNKCKNNLSLYK